MTPPSNASNTSNAANAADPARAGASGGAGTPAAGITPVASNAAPTTARVLIAGYGTVGRALHGILDTKRDELRRRYGLDVRVVGVARKDRIATDAAGLAASEPEALPWRSGSVIDLLWETEADVFVEATPTDIQKGQPALGHCRAAFHQGLPVVLANKGPLVVAYKDLAERAAAAGVGFRFEATVAAAVPTINAARHCLAGDTLRRVEGIVNGTTNFILTRMSDENSDFDQALQEAQALGYAERDPSGDIDGWDAAAKVVILGNALLGLDLKLSDVQVEGIRGVTRHAVELAAAHGYRVKLVAQVDRDGTARVGPRLVARGSPLDVGGVLNAVRFTTDLAGAITHVGHGAGGRATAAAVLSDTIDLLLQAKAKGELPRRRKATVRPTA